MQIDVTPDPTIRYSRWDQAIWQEELEAFVPVRIFDAHAHLWSDDYAAKDHPRHGDLVNVDMTTTRKWNEQLFPGRQMDYLILGTPSPGVDVAAHNRWVASEVAPHSRSRMFRLVTPQCRLEDIRKDIKSLGFRGLKPYRFYSVTGDIEECRIHEFLPHEQMELANELGLGVTMHLSRSECCADEVNLRDLDQYTRQYPKIKWILAHCARSFTYWPIRQAIERLRDMPNIWYDTSAVTDVMPHYTLMKKEDHRRILFGTDNLVANAFHGKYVAMGRYWFAAGTPKHHLAQSENDTIHRPVLSIYEQLLCMKHAADLAELSPSQIEDIFDRNARAVLD